MLVLDAFSSDTVPVHLLTREALSGYARLLRPGGVLLFNVSNRFYDLPGAVVATARSAGMDGASRGYRPTQVVAERYSGQASSWVVVEFDRSRRSLSRGGVGGAGAAGPGAHRRLLRPAPSAAAVPVTGNAAQPARQRCRLDGVSTVPDAVTSGPRAVARQRLGSADHGDPARSP